MAMLCVGFSNILTSISTTLHQAADKTSNPTSSQDENKTDEQSSTISTMPAVYDRTQVCKITLFAFLAEHVENNFDKI